MENKAILLTKILGGLCLEMLFVLTCNWFVIFKQITKYLFQFFSFTLSR